MSRADLDAAKNVNIRRAVDRDAEAMMRLTRDAYQRYVERIGREPAPMVADYTQLCEPACAWVAEHEGRIVGVLVCEWAPDHLLIENVAVHESVRGRGLGIRLLQWAEQQAQAAGVRQVRLYTNAAMHENVAYYPRRGFRETHRTEQDGRRLVFFAKDVEA
ncbi:N-acetylglutamate synthase, GNAT family [Quadrisphaera granulorum]|uniref:N-acetylglutamate synthase-like GNAT family acetyltransferase n=2 Tax=Quadrisphaera granulorum TaxID=317664 RepID=A0A316ACX8_9ACTN|nr:N-acetylglutamate synthase-like GNAT family acetyltransferase [Quadrisphaera granulorum]SZE98757.1 N-acetylglutamate synthase, GNAT family [Quadrisphaera granulorum]